MGISQMPDVDFPVLSVSVTWQGASPETMEYAIVDVLEDAVMTIEGSGVSAPSRVRARHPSPSSSS